MKRTRRKLKAAPVRTPHDQLAREVAEIESWTSVPSSFVRAGHLAPNAARAARASTRLLLIFSGTIPGMDGLFHVTPDGRYIKIDGIYGLITGMYLFVDEVRAEARYRARYPLKSGKVGK